MDLNLEFTTRRRSKPPRPPLIHPFPMNTGGSIPNLIIIWMLASHLLVRRVSNLTITAVSTHDLQLPPCKRSKHCYYAKCRQETKITERDENEQQKRGREVACPPSAGVALVERELAGGVTPIPEKSFMFLPNSEHFPTARSRGKSLYAYVIQPGVLWFTREQRARCRFVVRVWCI